MTLHTHILFCSDRKGRYRFFGKAWQVHEIDCEKYSGDIQIHSNFHLFCCFDDQLNGILRLDGWVDGLQPGGHGIHVRQNIAILKKFYY